MPHLKKDTITVRVSPFGMGSRRESVDVSFSVNSAGEFYCEVPERLLVAFSPEGIVNMDLPGVRIGDNRAGKKALYAESLKPLYDALGSVLQKVTEPEVSEEVLILYNIESHVSFAIDEHDEVTRNAKGNAQWPELSRDSPYGGHHAGKRAQGGYSLTVGAEVVTRTTIDYGDSKDVRDQRYNPSPQYDEHGYQHPAATLNEWTSFTLPEDCKSMPYSDEAALFFDDLMYGMARLSRMIQDRTFDQESLMTLIKSHQSLLPGPKRG
jgi:hypothetical protein